MCVCVFLAQGCEFPECRGFFLFIFVHLVGTQQTRSGVTGEISIEHPVWTQSSFCYNIEKPQGVCVSQAGDSASGCSWSSEPLCRLCTDFRNSGAEAVVLCLPDLLKLSRGGVGSLPSPTRLCQGRVQPARIALRRDTVGFVRQAHIPSRGLPARVSGAGVSWRWREREGSAKDFSIF